MRGMPVTKLGALLLYNDRKNYRVSKTSSQEISMVLSRHSSIWWRYAFLCTPTALREVNIVHFTALGTLCNLLISSLLILFHPYNEAQ